MFCQIYTFLFSNNCKHIKIRIKCILNFGFCVFTSSDWKYNWFLSVDFVSFGLAELNY